MTATNTAQYLGRKRSPETIEKMRQAKLGFDWSRLTDQEKADFDLCRKKSGMSRDGALRAIKRADLIASIA